jgi:gliding motility-associated-like protein
VACANTVITLSANAVSSATYNWTGPNNFQSTGNPVTILIPDSSYTGYYYLVLTDNVCTSAADSIFISMTPSPRVSVTGNEPHCPGTPVMLSAYNAALTGYQWLPGGENSSRITAGDTGTFIFVGTNSFGCTDTVEVDVTSTLIDDQAVWLPNAFTPNKDGKNDIFEAVGDYPCEELTFYVFNRWGELIYQLTASHITWNGLYDGKLVEQGVYVYMLKGKHTNRIGSITVMK